MSGPSVLEYARFHGLAIDHTSEDLLGHISHLPSLSVDDELLLLPDPQFSALATGLQEPKLHLSRLGSKILADSVRNPQATIRWDQFLPDIHEVRRLKIEEPLLSSDHETDVNRFRYEARTGSATEVLLERLSQLDRPPNREFEAEWSDIQSQRSLRAVERLLREEKVHTTRETVVHLSEILKDRLPVETKEEVLQSLLVPVKISQARPLTPLLVPDEPSPEHYIPSSPDLEFPSRSDEAVDLDDLILRVEQQMQEKDRILSDEVENANPGRATKLLEEARNPPREDWRFEATSLALDLHRQGRRNLEEFRLEVPMLSSPLSVEKTSTLSVTPSKPVSFGSVEQELVEGPPAQNGMSLEDALPAIPFAQEAAEAEACSQEDHDGLVQLAEKAAFELNQRFQEDNIRLPEGCLKLAVPELEAVPLKPPWETSREGVLASILDKECLTPTYPARVQSEGGFNWSPFPSRMMMVQMTEKIEGDNLVQDITKKPQGIIRSDQMLWKRPGLRILDVEDESEDEMDEDPELLLAMSKPPEPRVPKKRHEDDFDSALRLQVQKSSELFKSQASDTSSTDNSNSELFRTGFSASSALETFLDLRGRKFKKHVPLHRPSADELSEDPIQSTESDGTTGTSNPQDHTQTPVYPESRCPATVQIPSTPLLTARSLNRRASPMDTELGWPRTVVIDTAMLQRSRFIVDFLETKVGDKFTLLYREMNNLTERGREMHSAGPDIILNPQAGVIFTNLQALGQKSLPGQRQSAAQNTVQGRILQLAEVYAHVFVAITAPSVGASALQTHVDAISSFTAFCARASSDAESTVLPIWVSPKNESQTIEASLNELTWSLIHGQAFPVSPPSQGLQPSVPLIHEETLWERFLRKAGMNPMAAQVLLGMLKKPDPSSESMGDRSWGLRRLVQMSPDQKVGMFSDLLGAEVMERLNEVLDKESARQ